MGSVATLFFTIMLLMHNSVTSASVNEVFSFKDVTIASGIEQRRPSLKFGGPLVADMDDDGHYDLILSYHNGDRSQLYFGSASGKFTLTKFRTKWVDVHGFATAQRCATSRERLLTVSPGGGSGNNLKLPEVYVVYPNRTIEDISAKHGLGKRAGRGRNALFMDISKKSKAQRKKTCGGPDVIFTNQLSVKTPSLKHYAYRNIGGDYSIRSLPDYESEKKGHTEITDIDGDGLMEIISIQTFSIYSLIEEPGKPSKMIDVSSKVLPNNLTFNRKGRTVNAVAEIDYDNDGQFDLYVARGDRSTLSRLKPTGEDTSDRLFRNENGVYVDVTNSAGIPKGTNSVGVTTGDFNNDGYVDILVILYEEEDMILLNQGDGTFKRIDGLIPKDRGTVGNHAVAVDYNLDGKVDVIIGHGGDRPPIRGLYYLLRNEMVLNKKNNFLLVKVGNDLSGTATSLHATVTLLVRGKKQVQRVGSRGAQAGGGSYISTVHFGLGTLPSVPRVIVKWTSGRTVKKTNVSANTRICVGRCK